MRRRLVLRVALPFSIVMFLGLFASILLLKHAAWNQDAQAQAREVRTISGILATRLHLLETSIQARATAPLDVRQVDLADPPELERMLRADQARIDFDGAVVLRADGEVLSAIGRGGQPIAAAAANTMFGSTAADVVEMIRTVNTISGQALWEGVPSLMVATVTETGAEADGTALRPVIVYFEQLDASLLSRIGRLLGISNIYLGAPEDDQAYLPLQDLTGRRLTSIVWRPFRPGTDLLDEVMIPILAIFGILGIASIAVILLARHASQLIHASEMRALSDPLTGLPNRFLLEDRLQRALLSIRRNQERITLLYLDLDGFKGVNDTLGHAAGDDLIRQAADRLRSLVREMDTVARIGGDEFIIFQVGDSNAATIHQICIRLIDGLAEPFILDGNRVQIGVSIGAVCAPADGTEVSLLVRRADEAMYRAKRAGRGRYHRWSEPTGPGGIVPGAGSPRAMI